MKKNVTFLLLIVITIILNACNEKKNNSQVNVENTDNVIKIGVILPLDGMLRTMGEVEKNAILLAEDNVNKSGQKIEILIGDSKGKSSEAVSIANKFIDIDNVDLLFVSTTSASLAIEPIATIKQKNMIAFCMDLSIANKSKYVSRFYEGMDKETEVLQEYLKKINNKELVLGILHSNAPVIRDVVNNMYIPFCKRNNINVNYVSEYTLNDKDFKNTAAQIREKKINHLLILGHGFEYSLIYNSLEDYKLLDKLNILGGWGFIYTPVSKGKLEGTIVAGPRYVFDNDTTSLFYKAYKAKYNQSPNFDAAFAYNAIIEISKYNKKDFTKPLKNSLNREIKKSLILGEYHFDKEGNMVVELGLGKIQNGKIISYTQQ